MDKQYFDPKDLTKEKSIWNIYSSSKKIPFSKFNLYSTLFISALLIINAWFSTQSISETTELIRQLSDTGLNIALSTLGFLLAGFTVFATISQPNLSLRMAEIINPKSGINYLKHNYFIFIRVFIYYMVFAVFCLMIIMFGHKGGLLSQFISLSPSEESIKTIIVKVSYVLILTGYYFLIMQLKSFIFNIYHSVMTALRWKAEGYD